MQLRARLIACIAPAFLTMGCTTGAATAQADAAESTEPQTINVDPPLWVIKDADTTIYLFGTIHMLNPKLDWFNDGVRAAFDASDTLVMEIADPNDPAMAGIMFTKGKATDGIKLSDRFDEENRAAYAAMMHDNGLPAAAFDQMKPWVAILSLQILPLLKEGFDPNSGPETVLSKAAKARSMKVIGLETAEQQIAIFDEMTIEEQMGMLTEIVKNPSQTTEQTLKLVEYWQAGDADGMGAYLADSLTGDDIENAIFKNRNVHWADWLNDRMETPGTVFVAVGAGHLVGPNNVRLMLENKNITAERVVY